MSEFTIRKLSDVSDERARDNRRRDAIRAFLEANNEPSGVPDAAERAREQEADALEAASDYGARIMNARANGFLI
ncbi:MAG: hypothetical protein AAFR23_03715 [Pseudomonadota bacterium]